jgi:A/G-specific adenine glycosylase
MWEVPHAPIGEEEEIYAAAIRVTKELTGLNVELEEQFATIHHSVTRYRITLVCFEAKYLGGRFTPGFYSASDWLTPDEMENRPVSSPQRKLMMELGARLRKQKPEIDGQNKSEVRKQKSEKAQTDF